MKLIKNYFYNAGYQLLVMIVPLLTTPYVNRVLGPRGIGINTYTNSIIQYFILFGSIGVALYGNRQIAYDRDNPAKMTLDFWEIQIVKTTGIFISIVFFLIYLVIFAKYKWFMLLQFINIIAALFDISWFFQGNEEFKTIVVRNTTVKLISVCLIFLLIRSKSDIGLYIFIYAISSLVGNLTLWPHLKRFLVRINLKELRVLRHVKPTIIFFLPEVSVQVYQTFNKTILGYFAGTNASGYYMNSDTIVKLLLYLVTAISTVMLPHISNEFAKGNTGKIKKTIYLTANVTTCLSMAFVFGIAAISLQFSPIFFGPSFKTVGPTIMMEAPVIYFAGFSTVIGNQFLLPTNRMRIYTNSLVLGAALSIVLDVLLIPFLGLFGAIIVTVMSEMAVFLYQIIKIRRQLSFYSLFKDTMRYFIAGLVMFIVVFYLDLFMKSGIFSLTIQIFVGTAIYGILIFVLKTECSKLVVNFFRNNKEQ